MLASETDASVRKELQLQLRQTQLDMAGSDGESMAALENDRQYRRNRAVQYLVSATNLAMEQALANQSCWTNRPDLLQQMVGLGSAVGYSAAMVAPASGAALAVGAGLQVVGGVIDYIKQLIVKKKVRAFTKALDPIDSTCAIEKMNQVYCAARDTDVTISVLSKAGSGMTTDPLSARSATESSRVARFSAWLEKLRTGAGSVASPEDADRVAFIENQKLRLEQSLRYLQGFIEITNLFACKCRTTRPIQYLRDFICMSAILHAPWESAFDHPLCAIYSADFIPFYLLGITRDQALQLSSKYQGLTFNQVDLTLLAKENIPIDIDFDKVEPRFIAWHALANRDCSPRRRTSWGTIYD